MNNILSPLEWHTTQRKVRELVPCDFNPRSITDTELKRLKESLEKFNLVEIPVIDIDNTLIAGHQRVAVLFMLERGEDEIDVRIPNRKLTEEEFKEYMLRSNINNGEFDWEKIEEFFQDIDLDLIGMDTDAFDDFLSQNASQPPEEEGDFDATIYEKYETAEGDLFELKSIDKGITHRFMCGSSTDSENWDKVMNGDKLDLLLTDPPYNVDYQGGTKDKMKIKNDKMSNDSFHRFLYDFFVNTYVFSKAGAPVYVFYSDSEAINFRKSMLDAGYKISATLVWVKNSFVLGRLDYHMQHEPIIFCEETIPDEIETHRSLMYGWNADGAHPWYSDRKQSSILRFDKPLRNADHPTMKPLDLIGYLIKNSSKQKDIVADGFLGSGSTLIASEQNWRQCRGFELDTRFSDVIVRRWVAYMKENKLKYEVWRNGVKLSEKDIAKFNKK